MDPKQPPEKETSHSPDEESPPACCSPDVGSACCGPGTSGGDCCAPPSTTSNRGRFAVFLAVMAVAAAVLVYGLFFNRGGRAGETSAADMAPGGTAPAAANPVPADVGGACGSGAPAVTAVSVPEGNDVLFVFLPGTDQERAQEVALLLDAGMEKIRRQGKTVTARTICEGAEGFGELVSQCAVSSFPCVIALGKECGWTTVPEKITESKILQAFVIAAQAPSGCEGCATGCPMVAM